MIDECETLDQLKKDFPKVDFVAEYNLIDSAEWGGFEESRSAYLFLHVPTDSLFLLEDNYCVMVKHEDVDFKKDLKGTSWDEWFELKHEIEEM